MMALCRTGLRPFYVNWLLKSSLNRGMRHFHGASWTRFRVLSMRGNQVAGALLPRYCDCGRDYFVQQAQTQQHLYRALSMSQAQLSESEGDSEGKDDKKPVKKRLDVEYDALVSLIEQGIVRIFDVREPKEVEQTGRIPTAINIPLPQLKMALSEDVEDYRQMYGEPRPGKDEEHIVFYGLSGVKSSAAVEIAHKLGYKKFKHHYGVDLPGSDDEIVFSCAKGVRSLAAVNIAEQLGFTRAKQYPGGWTEWSQRQQTEE